MKLSSKGYIGLLVGVVALAVYVNTGPIVTPAQAQEAPEKEKLERVKTTERIQADQAVAYIEAQVQPGVGLHNSMYRHVADPVFICWEDIPRSL